MPELHFFDRITNDTVIEREFYRTFSAKWHEELDNGHGDCVLRDSQLAKIVDKSLRHADADKYALTDFVVIRQ